MPATSRCGMRARSATTGLPAMSLPSASVSTPGRVVVRRRRQDLDQLHHLPARIGQLEAHARLAGDRLDHADRHHRQRAREVLDQVDDLRALHADRGLDLVARDHRARIGGEHLRADAEVGELALDEPRRVFERLVAHRFLRGRRFLEQRERRQLRVGHVGEERPLPFLDHALGLRHVHDRRHDDHRLALDLDLAPLHDDLLALGRGLLADAAVLGFLAPAACRRDQRLDAGADALHHAQPRDAEKQREPDQQHREQQQRGAVEAERARRALPERVAERAAGRRAAATR